MIRRVFMATINYDHPQTGMEQAFRQIFGRANVETFDYLELQRKGHRPAEIAAMFVGATLAFKPDWVWLQLQDTNIIKGVDIMDVRNALPNCVVTHWTGDCRPKVSDYLSSICKATHMSLISSVGQGPLFSDAGAEVVRYVQIGLDWDEDVLGLPEWTPPFRVPDVVFIGNYYAQAFPEGTKERQEAIDALLKDGIDVGIVGTGWPAGYPMIGTCTVKQQHHVWKRAKVAISCNHFNNVDRYYSDRQLIAMASGTPVVCRQVPGLQEEFIDFEDCIFYDRPDNLLWSVKSLLQDPEMRQRIGRNGRQLVMRKHSWFSRVLDLLPKMEHFQERLGR
jgi:hypothetical protein